MGAPRSRVACSTDPARHPSILYSFLKICPMLKNSHIHSYMNLSEIVEDSCLIDFISFEHNSNASQM